MTSTISMEDLYEILTLQMIDANIPIKEEYLILAMEHYRDTGIIPDIDYIIANLLQNKENSKKVDVIPMTETEMKIPKISPQYHEERIEISKEEMEMDDNEHSTESKEDDTEHDSKESDEEMEMAFDETKLIDVKSVIHNIDEIELKSISDDMIKNKDNLQCMLCYDNFMPTDLFRNLLCGHRFHPTCIDDYLKTKSYLCPTCRCPTGNYKLINL